MKKLLGILVLGLIICNITYEGYHIGGTRKTGGKSWKMFEGTFLKFFKKNLLN